MVRGRPPEVRSRNDLLAAAELNGATLSVADCQSLDRKRMAMTLEVTGTPEAIAATIATLRMMAGVEQAYEIPADSQKTRVFMTLQKPRICRTSANSSVLCVDCPFDSAEVPTRWRLDLRRTGSAGQVVARLAEEEIQAATDLISPVNRGTRLTPRERGIVTVAIERGYFEFPRRITLEGLSRLVGVEAATLRTLFRSLE